MSVVLDPVIACDIDGNNTSITGVSHILQTTDGCDSVLTLNLVIADFDATGAKLLPSLH